jgi:hypothetical protein
MMPCRIVCPNNGNEVVHRAVKSLHADSVLTHPLGPDGYVADAVREVQVLQKLEGVAGTPVFCDMLTDFSEGIHIIMECAPLCHSTPGIRCSVDVLVLVVKRRAAH